MSKEKLSRIVGLRLLAIKEGVECGAIREVVMDVEKKSVEYLVLDTGKGCFGFCVLPNNKIAGMGKDFAITVSSEYVTGIWHEEEAMKLAYTDSDLIGARVVSSTGDVIGKIVDFEFELVEGLIDHYIMEDGNVLPSDCIVTLSRGIVFIDKEHLEDLPSHHVQIHEMQAAMPEEEPIVEMPIVETPITIKEVQPVVAPVAEPPVVIPPVVAPIAAPVAVPVVAAPVVEPLAQEVVPAAQAQEEPQIASRLAALRNRAPAAGQEANADMKNYFEKRRTEFLIGKTVKQKITDASGAVLADVGNVVTAEMIEKIKEADKIIELTMGVN